MAAWPKSPSLNALPPSGSLRTARWAHAATSASPYGENHLKLAAAIYMSFQRVAMEVAAVVRTPAAVERYEKHHASVVKLASLERTVVHEAA